MRLVTEDVHLPQVSASETSDLLEAVLAQAAVAEYRGLVARAAVPSHSCGGREAGTSGAAWSGSGESTLPSF